MHLPLAYNGTLGDTGSYSGGSRNIPACASPYSVSFWIRWLHTNFTSGNQGGSIYLSNDTTWREDCFIEIYQWSGIGATFDRNFILYPSWVFPCIGAWKKVVYVRTASGGYVFVDGRLAIETSSYTQPAGSTYYWSLQTAFTSGPTYNGYYTTDGFTWWDRALTKAEAAHESLHRDLMPSAMAGCLSVWDFSKSIRNGVAEGYCIPAYSRRTQYTGIDSASAGDIITIDDLAIYDPPPFANYRTPLSSILNRVPIVGSGVLVQVAYPNQDATSVWTNESDGSSNLYQSIDEVTPSDADYVQSPFAPSNSQQWFRLSGLTDPASSSGHVVRYRFRKSGGETLDYTVHLSTSASTSGSIASKTHNGVGTDWVTDSFTLTGGEADSITDYTEGHLYIGLIANKP